MIHITPSLKNNLLKLLICIGIIAILASVYIQYGKPYLIQRDLEKQDLVRISDLDKLNTAIQDILSASSTAYLGESNTIYISIPSNDPTCGDLNLPELVQSWRYKCSNNEEWLPNSIQDKVALTYAQDISNMNHYSYVVSHDHNSGTSYTLTTKLQSNNYIKEVGINDFGFSSTMYEIGNNSTLLPQAIGLIAFYPLNNQQNRTVKNLAGDHTAGTWLGDSSEETGSAKFNGRNLVIFDGSDETSIIGNASSSYTISLWIKDVIMKNQSLTEKWETSDKYPWAIRFEGKNIICAMYDGKKWFSVSAKLSSISSTEWNSIICSKDVTTSKISLYVNGTLQGMTEIPKDLNTANNEDFTLAARSSRGDYTAEMKMANFSLYTRNLTESDILRLYLTEKKELLIGGQ